MYLKHVRNCLFTIGEWKYLLNDVPGACGCSGGGERVASSQGEASDVSLMNVSFEFDQEGARNIPLYVWRLVGPAWRGGLLK